MDTEKIKALATLGYYFNLHLLRSLIPRKKADQVELFLGYFREDRIASFTPAEHQALLTFEGCVACGLCPAHCRVMELSEGKFRGPLHLAVAASRSHPDFLHDLDSLLLCAVCGQCEPICPQKVPISAMARAMRAMIWRVQPESLPSAYHSCQQNLEHHGNIYGPPPPLHLPRKTESAAAIVFGPALRQEPERCEKIFQVLTRLGYDLTVVAEGSWAGLAQDLGLVPDTKWVKELASLQVKTIIVVDPALVFPLKSEPSLSGKSVIFLTEAMSQAWPDGLSLAGQVQGQVAVHDPVAIAREGNLGQLARELLCRGKLSVGELAATGEATPPVGWEGGLALVAPELAGKLAKARLAEAKAAGVSGIVTFSLEDFKQLKTVEGESGVKALYFADMVASVLE